MKSRHGLVSVVTLCLAVVSCSAKSIGIAPPSNVAQTGTPRIISSQRGSNLVENKFEKGQNKELRDADYDTYIDQDIVGQDRKLAKRLMKFMPKNQRGDFLYLGPGDHLVSNNRQLLAYAKITHGSVAGPGESTAIGRPSSRSISTTRQIRDYTSSCSPPNPPSAPRGAYLRFVSKCGFSAGWGFVSWPQGASNIPSGDAGHVYFEVAGMSGSLSEGGLEVYSDSSIAPYARITNQSSYVSLNNNSVRYVAGTEFGLFHGLAPNQLMYTIVGVATNLNPKALYLSHQAVNLANTAWLFYNAPYDMVGTGIDPAGKPAPCVGCSVSKVTSMGQNNVGSYYAIDGSWFGVTPAGENAIAWD